MKLSKKQLQQLRSIFNDMTKAETFLYGNSVEVAKKTKVTCAKENTLINQGTGEAYCAINKNVGSDLCYFNNALTSMNNFLNNNQ